MKKHLYREQPFVIQRSASMLDDGWKNETVLVQGIIDAYFMEEEEIVLVDYKTDRVKRGQEQKLIDLYHVQLEDYAGIGADDGEKSEGKDHLFVYIAERDIAVSGIKN